MINYLCHTLPLATSVLTNNNTIRNLSTVYRRPLATSVLTNNNNYYLADGTSEDDFFIVALEDAEQMITCSQADQALCDEAECGRLHGEGSLLQDNSGLCWLSQRGNFRLHLQEGNYFVFPSQVIGDFDSFSLGEPRIDTLQSDGRQVPANEFPLWDTLFQYLRIAILNAAAVNPCPQYLGGVKPAELELARTLCKKFQLGGNWQGRNRISNGSFWYEDKTLLYQGDLTWFLESVSDTDGVQRSLYEWKLFDNGRAIVLPVTFLRRNGFLGLRRVFWLSEDTLYPIRRGQGISGIVHVTLSLPFRWLSSDDLWLCYPGGAAAVEICDLAPLRNRTVDIIILHKQGRSGWEFAMRFAARLRRENIPFSLTLLQGNKCTKLSMNEFRQCLVQWQLRIPPELSIEYRGDLTEWMTRSPRMLIPGTLNEGEVIHLAGALAPEIILHLTTALRSGCWNEHWNAVGANMQIAVFADKHNLALCRNQGLPDQHLSWRTANLTQEEMEHAIAEAKIVIIASTEMTRDIRKCEAIIKYCVDHEIGVIVLSEAGNGNTFLQRVATKTYFFQVRHSCGEKEFYLANQSEKFGIHFTIAPDGALCATKKLSHREIAEVQQELPASLPDNGVAEFQRMLTDIPQQSASGNPGGSLKLNFPSGI